MDTLLVKTATKKFDEALAAMEAELEARDRRTTRRRE